ncbi:MAG: endonuclease MutS2 [Bacteroidota bacterium]
MSTPLPGDKIIDVMNERTLRVLEYDKILAMLAAEASCALGQRLAETLRPDVDPARVSEKLAETSEARRAWEEGRVPLGGLHDVTSEIERARVGGVLAPEELLRVGSTLAGGRKLREFFAERRERYPGLWAVAARCGAYREIEDELARCLGPAGEVLDTASPELKRLRNLLRTLQNRIRDKLESVVRSSEQQRFLQDALVTLRNERYVIPVKQEYKGMFPGIVHDQSASGATVFIEPMAVVELNNQLRAAEAEEQEEVFRILSRLSGLVGDQAPSIIETLQALAALDLASAKGRLSLKMGGYAPEVNDEGVLELRGARHPLLSGNVVPIDIALGREFDTLVITGPNTGGKTVALKTVGLLTLMAQSGLHIPVRIGSAIAVFSEVACDIGDEQSIEQSLSTFSSHLTHIVAILRQLQGAKTLVLLDELGAGTDPTEGAALAMAILEYLHARKARTVATTHYSELKVFAYQTPGVQNASVEFDVATLRPTYRLMVGLPGRSNAFAIASRLGLEPTVISRAESLVSREDRQVEELIGSIAEDAKAARDARRSAEELRVHGDRFKREYETELARLKQERAELIRSAKKEAREILNDTRRETENLLRLLQEAENEGERRQAAKLIREEISTRLNALAEEDPAEIGPPGEAPSDLRPGEAVHIRSLDKTGHVVALNNDDTALLQIGIMKVTRPLSDLARAENTQKAERGGEAVGALGRAKAFAISPELDLRGMRVEEALTATDKYLDDLALAGMSRARIIHGKGTGALRAAIGEYLQGHPRIRAARMGLPNEGGAGVTIVELA